jgi:tryptophan-rich sensory protein
MKLPPHLLRSSAAAMLAPYAGWVAFATALNAAIALRNR